MLELFKAECRRFRWLALGVGVAHLGLLLFFDRVMDPLQQSRAVYQGVALTYAVLGALLGAFQFGLYARTNHWVALLHRPLSPSRILAAIGGAGASVLVAVVFAPLALFLVAHQALTPRFVDPQHWLLIVSGLSFALIGYLVAAYIALAPRRFGWLIFFVAIIPAAASAVGFGAILIQAAIVAILAGLVRTMFKPDLSLAPRRVWPLAVTALLFSLGLNRALLLVGDFGFQVLWILTGTHPLNSIPPKGGYVEATRAEAADLMVDGLAARRDPRAQIWREQIRLSETFSLPTATDWVPVRGQLMAEGPREFEDKKRHVLWTFSDDAMAFVGVRQTDMSRAGVLKVADHLVAPPVLAEGGMLTAGNRLFAFDEDKGRFEQRLAIPGGETILGGPVIVGDSAVLLGNRSLHFFDRRDLGGDQPRHSEIARVPLPGPVANIQRIDAIELLDGYLLSFTYGRDTPFGPTDAWQEMIEVDGAGHGTTVARRGITQDFPTASRFARYWISPLLNEVRTGLETAGAGQDAAWDHQRIRVPTSVWTAASIIAVLAALATFLLARRRRLGQREALLWTLAAFLLSLPMALTFWLLKPRPRG